MQESNARIQKRFALSPQLFLNAIEIIREAFKSVFST